MAALETNDKKLFLQLLIFHIAMAAVSLLVTGHVAALEGVRYLLLPVVVVLRLMTLVLFTLPACLMPHKRTGVLLMSGLWVLWQGVAAGRYIEGGVTAGLVILAAIPVFILVDRRERVELDRFLPQLRKAAVLLYFSLVFVFVLEIMQTCSLLIPLRSMFTQPDVLACNLLYFTALGSFVLWIKRPYLGGVFYLIFWIFFGIASLCKNLNNFEPVMIADTAQVLEGMTALYNIISVPGFIAMFVLIAAATVGLIIFGIKAKKQAFSKAALVFSLCFMLLGVSTGVLSTLLPWISFDDVSPREVFDRNGYVYSFITTGYRTARLKPGAYESQDVGDIIRALDPARSQSDDNGIEQLNIVVFQLESFIDPYDVEGAVYERDPIPFIRSLGQKYTSGEVSVSIFGGQTVKSEFEFLTGFSMANLPYGYNPYALYLDDNAIDSLPRYLRSIGFNTVGLHDYQGEFFRRSSVYGNLGFETFVPYELMSGAQRKEGVIWSDDGIFLDQIKLVLEGENNDKNFIFAVTVQTHGGYPSLDESEYPMQISGIEDKTAAGKLAYYISQLEEVDRHIRDICEYFDTLDEPTLVVLYSDHLPTFALDLPGYSSENRFNVHYYTYNNMGIPKTETGLIPLNELSTYMCAWLDMDGSFMNRFHRDYRENPDYEALFELIQYYKMFDEPDETEYSGTDFKLGLEELYISAIEFDAENNSYTVTGGGITENTYLCVNGRVYDTVYVDANTLRLETPKREIQPGDEVLLRVIGEKYGGVLKESEPYDWS